MKSVTVTFPEDEEAMLVRFKEWTDDPELIENLFPLIISRIRPRMCTDEVIGACVDAANEYARQHDVLHMRLDAILSRLSALIDALMGDDDDAKREARMTIRLFSNVIA